MPTSQNGWYAAPDLPRRPLVVRGVEFVGGIVDNDNVATVLNHVLEQFHDRVEPLRNPGCWGFSYRANANNPTALSNHSSGTAVDANAPAHPNGVPKQKTFTLAQINEVHQILGEVDDAIRWGGDYTVTPDAMHFEVNTDREHLAAVAARIREATDMTPDQANLLEQIAADTKALRKNTAKVREKLARLIQKGSATRDDLADILTALDQED